jgi:hypothetical protein
MQKPCPTCGMPLEHDIVVCPHCDHAVPVPRWRRVLRNYYFAALPMGVGLMAVAVVFPPYRLVFLAGLAVLGWFGAARLRARRGCDWKEPDDDEGRSGRCDP